MRYVNLAYREGSNTAKQYLWAFTKFAPGLATQQGLDNFVITYMRGSKRNPFYAGFFKAYLDCFEIEYKFPKDLSRAKNYEGTKKRKFLTIEEVKTLIHGTSPYISLMVRIYFDTGLRLRELINTKIDNIDLDERTIEGIGKNGKPFCEKMSPETLKHLKNHINSADFDDEYPFKVRTCTDHAKSFWYFLKKEGKLLGIDNVTPHKLRHALGRYLHVDLGLDLDKVKVKLRHSRLETTNIYAYSTKEEVDAIIDEKVFGGLE